MALRSAAERAEVLRAWRADPRNAVLTPPVEVEAPGTKAARRATVAQKKAVQQVLQKHLDELARLELKHMRALLPVFRQAEAELSERLKSWIQRTPDGELRWTAWKYRSALVQLRGGVEQLERAMGGALIRGGVEAQRLSLKHLTNEVARCSQVFGGADQVPQLQLNLAALVATGQSSLVPRFRASAERYAWGSETGVWKDINQRLAVDIMSGASVFETIDRLQQQGGPRGLVALQGVAGEEGAIVQLIPEGLFARYRSRAETYVRTELAAAYALQMRQGLRAARGILPDLKRRWCSDGTGCPRICQPMDGQVVGLEQPFIDGEGHAVDDQPAHPRCRCRVGPWREHWSRYADLIGEGFPVAVSVD